MSSEQVATDAVAAAQEVIAQSLAPAHRRRRRPRHRRADRVPAVPEGGRPAPTARSRPASSRAPSSSPRRTPSSTSIPRTRPAAAGLVTFHPSDQLTLLTMWIVMAIVVVGSAILMVRGSKLVPGRGQNIFEIVYEFLSDFGLGIAGPTAPPYIPIFLGAFLLVLFDNWIGLVPPVGKVEFLRAPSSDVNITIGMALVSFLIFHIEGFRHLGVRGYLGKFFPFYEFRNGIGAGHHRPVRRPHRADARVRQAGHAVDAALRQHLRRRGRPRRHHGLTIAIIPVALLAARWHAERDPGPDLQRPDARVHHARDREPSRGGGPRRREDVMAEIKGTEPQPASPADQLSANAGNNIDPGQSCPGTRRDTRMEHIGAGLAALGVIGPGIGIGILAGLSATGDRPQPGCGGPDPRHRDHPRGVRRRPRRPRDRRRPARDLHQAG